MHTCLTCFYLALATLGAAALTMLFYGDRLAPLVLGTAL
jgi:hypothetical protein